MSLPGVLIVADQSTSLQQQSPGITVFRSLQEWEAFWTTNSELPLPEADWDEEFVIALFWPIQSGCSDVAQAVTAVRHLDTHLQVVVGPLPHLGDCRALQSPRELLRTQRREGPVQFVGFGVGEIFESSDKGSPQTAPLVTRLVPSVASSPYGAGSTTDRRRR